MSEDICKNLNFKDTQKIGIEIGSLYFKAVGIGIDTKTTWRIKKRHQGNAKKMLKLFREQAKIRGIPLAVACRTLSDTCG